MMCQCSCCKAQASKVIVIPQAQDGKDDCCCRDPFENTPNAIFLKLSDCTIQGIITLIASII